MARLHLAIGLLTTVSLLIQVSGADVVTSNDGSTVVQQSVNQQAVVGGNSASAGGGGGNGAVVEGPGNPTQVEEHASAGQDIANENSIDEAQLSTVPDLPQPNYHAHHYRLNIGRFLGPLILSAAPLLLRGLSNIVPIIANILPKIIFGLLPNLSSGVAPILFQLLNNLAPLLSNTLPWAIVGGLPFIARALPNILEKFLISGRGFRVRGRFHKNLHRLHSNLHFRDSFRRHQFY